MIEQICYCVLAIGSILSWLLFVKIEMIERDIEDSNYDLLDADMLIRENKTHNFYTWLLWIVSIITAIAFGGFFFLYGSRMIYNWFFV